MPLWDKKKRNGHAEDDEQEALFQWAGFIPELKWMHSIPNGGKRNVREAARLKRQGVKSGISDIFLPLARSGCHGLYIEMKRPDGKGRLTDNQREFGGHATKEGYRFRVCNSFSEAKAVIEDYLKT